MSPELQSYIKGWLEKANNDLISAQRLIEIEPMILDNACFHCQQAIEKYLKAFLIFKGKDIERTHNINFLLIECVQYDNSFNDIDVKNINAFAVQIRYPDDTIMPELPEAKEYYQIALEVKKIVLNKVKF